MSLSSQPDDREGAQNALNTVITVLKKSQLSCSGSHIPHSISQVPGAMEITRAVTVNILRHLEPGAPRIATDYSIGQDFS